MKQHCLKSFLLIALVILLLLSGMFTLLGQAAVLPNSGKDGTLRVLLTSDIHYCTSAYYGVAGKDRLQLWVDSVNAEHKREPLDFIIVVGDMSLDHFYSNGNIAGSYMGTNKVSYTEKFIKEYVSQLPSDVPKFFVPGNHEQYSNAQWKSITGNDRQGSYRLEGNLFIMLDNYNSHLEPYATENSVYTPSDMEFIQSEMAKYPDDKVWLVSHYFQAGSESEAFKQLVKENDRIMGLFGGHDHMGDVKSTTAWGTKPYSMCGTFALSGTVTAEHSAGQPQKFGYEAKTLTDAQQESLDLTLANFWGFRELKITPETAESNYISVATGSTAPYFYGRKITLSRTLKYKATYASPEATANWGPASDGIYYIGSAADMKAFCTMGQSYNFAGKTVKLARDIDMTGVNWTMIPQFSGTFDGCGRAIKNLTLYATSGTLAMFDQLQGATIQNLRMTDGEVKLVDSHSAAGIAVRANGDCTFRNVYCKMKVSVDSDCYRAGGFLAFPERGNILFENCVSECTVAGMRGAGFVAQVNYNNYSVTLKDCAFIGDLSAAGKWSGGIVGLCAGNVTMERCVSLGKQSPNAESGGMIFIDHQNQSETTVTTVLMKDCYAAVDTQVPIGTQSARSFRLNFTLEYTGKTPYTVITGASNLLSSHQANLQKNFGYLAKASTINLTTSNLKTLCPALTNWSYGSGTTAYGTSKTVPKILPTATLNLMNGKSITAAPSSICTLCGGNANPMVNLGNGTHLISCDRETVHSIRTHTYSNGKCACGQRECPYLLVDFLPTSEKHTAADWIPTQKDTGTATVTVNLNGAGTLEGTAIYRDAYVSLASALERTYAIQTGDVVELRIKGTITAGTCGKTAVYFTTDKQGTYSETHQVNHAVTFNGSYQTVTLGSLDGYAGELLKTLRVDMFQQASADFSGSYALDYIYIGPAELAPSKERSALYFDFSDDEDSARRYGTSTYRGYNYDAADNWRRGETGANPVVTDGKLCFDITQRYNAGNEPVHITAIEPVGAVKTFSWGNDSKYANDLNYDPSKAEVFQIRLRLTDVKHYYPNHNNQYLRLFYLPEGATEWSCGTAPNDWAESILIPIDSQYLDGGAKESEFFTLQISLSGKKFSTYERIRGIMLNFMGMREGSVEIDYIYIGPKPEKSLLFDFNGTGADRYDTVAYGNMDYDTTEHWFHEADVSTATIDGGELTLTLSPTPKNDHTQYIETSKVSTRRADPLHFTASEGDVIQVRYRILTYDATVNSGKSPTITVYGWDSGNNATYQGTAMTAVDIGKLGTYITRTWDIPAKWTTYDITRLRVTFRGLLNSQVAIDYIYVGSGCTAPTVSHKYTSKVTVPTCTAQGYTTHTCSRCFDSYKDTYTNATGHSYTSKVTTAATCTKNGVKTFTCSKCNNSYTEAIAATGHTEVVDKAVSATCTTAGKTEGSHCSVCNALIKAQTTVPATDHSYTSKVTTAATCTKAGVKTFTCSKCNHSYTEAIAATGHTEVIDKAVAATCTTAGKTEGSHCSVCNAVIKAQTTVPATGHSYTSKVTTAATCTKAGVKTFTCSKCNHSYTEAIAATGHTEVVDKAVAATCTTAGKTEGSHCSVCNAVIKAQTTIPATGHSYTSKVTTAATCTKAGVKTFTCSKCSHSYTEAIAATGHTEVIDKAVAATCTTDGKTEGSHCSVCNAVIKAQTTVPATGHSYTSKVTTAATCTKDGVKTFTCSKCNNSYTEAIAATGHTEVIDKAVAATCTTTGKTEGSHCSVCNAVIKAQTTVPATGHSYSYKSNGNGTHAVTCARCNDSYTENHNFGNGACACGDAEITLDESIKILHTLDLASDISVTFAVAKTALANYDSFYLECVLPEYNGNTLVGTSTVQVQPVVSGNYYYFTLTGITAVRMGDMVDAVLHMTKGEQEYYSKTDSYSVSTYAYGMLNSSKDAKMLTLCADLLRYGAEAQSFKGYRTDALVDADMTEVHRSYLSNTNTLTFTATDSYMGDLANPTITWVGKTLDLGSKVGMKFVFNAKNYTGDLSKLSMKVSYVGSTGETKSVTVTGIETYNANNKQYSFTFYGLLASELRTIVDVAIYEGNTQLSETLRYSAESYAAKTGTTALAALTKALFAYSDSAKAFFAKY